MPDRLPKVLGRHGLGYLVGMLGLERFMPFHRGLLGHPRRLEPYTRPEHIRMALEDLGAAWVKLGQILSTRADLLPPEYQAELAKLQDAAPPVLVEAVRAVIATELGRPPEELFAHFDPRPLAAASIDQAHAATLFDGTEVVVKVRRPGVIEQDLELFLNLAAAASRRLELAETLRAELDYLQEGRNAERFARNFGGDPMVHIPRVFWETTTSRVLTLERIRGIKVNDLLALEAAGVERSALAERAARILLKMVFEDGFFPRRPAPGQLLRRARRAHRADRLRDGVDAFLDLGVARRGVDREGLREDLRYLTVRYYGRPLGGVAVGPLLVDALAVVRRHRLHLPTNLALLFKMMMAEGLAAQLDPDFRLTTVLVSYAEGLMLRQYSPLRWARRLGTAGLEAAELGVELPRQLRRLLRELERGGLQLGMRPEGFEPLLGRFERLTNRLVLGMLASAFIIGLAVLMAFHPPGTERLVGPAFGLGFVIAVIPRGLPGLDHPPVGSGLRL